MKQADVVGGHMPFPAKVQLSILGLTLARHTTLDSQKLSRSTREMFWATHTCRSLDTLSLIGWANFSGMHMTSVAQKLRRANSRGRKGSPVARTFPDQKMLNFYWRHIEGKYFIL